MKESVGVGARSLHGAKMRYGQRPAGDQARLSSDTRYFIKESNTETAVRTMYWVLGPGGGCRVNQNNRFRHSPIHPSSDENKKQIPREI